MLKLAGTLVAPLLVSLVVACSTSSEPAFPDLGTPRDATAADVLGDVPAVDQTAADLSPDLPAVADVPVDVAADTQDAASPCAGDGDCDDGDKCTLDRCVDGACAHDELPAGFCCWNDDECDDGIECTRDICPAGMCEYVRSTSSCCVNAADCDDADGCTLDLCVASSCAHVRVRNEDACLCTDDRECDDGLDCTDGACEGGECVYTPTADEACCVADGDCDDGDPTTADRCERNTCAHDRGRACIVAEHCDDGDACTTDDCVEGMCAHTPELDCCHVDGLCADGVAATVDRCHEQRCVHVAGDPRSCDDGSACDDANPCTRDVCVAGLCSTAVAEGEDCCVDDGACDDGDPCTTDACVAFACVRTPVTGLVPQAGWRFDDGAIDGFTVVDDGSGSHWQVVDIEAVSPPYSLYFGDLTPAPNLGTGRHVQGTVQTPNVALPDVSDIDLAVWIHADVEPLYSVDQFRFVVVPVGGEEAVIWTKEDLGGSTGSAWEQVHVDLAPWRGQTVGFRLELDSVDDHNTDETGFFVDDFLVRWACPGDR